MADVKDVVKTPAGSRLSPRASSTPTEVKNGEMYVDLQKYFSEPLEFNPGEERAVRAIRIFLNPNAASKLATKFLVGTQKIVFYGHPALLLTRSKILQEAKPDDVKAVAVTPMHLAANTTFNKIELKGFLVAWLYVNGMTDMPGMGPAIWSYGLNLEQSVAAFKWLIYFAADLTNEGANIWISGIALDAYKRVEAKGTFTQAEFDALNSFTRTVIRLTAQSQDYMAVGYNTLKYLLPIMGISADERQFLMTVYIRQVNLCYADSSYSCQAEIAELGK